ncbi:hypothetical protein ACFWD7_33665 [Streptomyces mirabilis]|uniref:hypothetical protein n=1 Tax=Streptomyces mirabilis TaxID=68239 RepID=UPI0036777CDE
MAPATPGSVDRGRTGSRHHLITGVSSIPLVVTFTVGNRTDVTQLIPLLEALPPIRGTEHGFGLGAERRVAGRTFDRLHWFRRLRIR